MVKILHIWFYLKNYSSDYAKTIRDYLCRFQILFYLWKNLKRFSKKKFENYHKWFRLWLICCLLCLILLFLYFDWIYSMLNSIVLYFGSNVFFLVQFNYFDLNIFPCFVLFNCFYFSWVFICFFLSVWR